MDTPKSGQPPYNRQAVCPLPTTVCMLEPPKKGQPPKNTRPQRVHCSVNISLNTHTHTHTHTHLSYQSEVVADEDQPSLEAVDGVGQSVDGLHVEVIGGFVQQK